MLMLLVVATNRSCGRCPAAIGQQEQQPKGVHVGFAF